MDNQRDLFTLVEAQTLNDEIKQLTDLNQRLVEAAKKLGYADDVHEWDDAWSKMCKIMKECKEVGVALQTAS
jgi:hypothetical protein